MMTAPTTAPPAPDASAEDIAERHLRVLAELAEIGMRLARTVERQAAAQSHLQDVGEQAGVSEIVGGEITLVVKGDFGLVFSRIARAVRLTLALEAKVYGDLLARRAQIAAAQEGREAEEAARLAAEESSRRAAREDRVHRVVEKAIRAEIDDEDEIERLTDDLYERLDEDEAYEDYGDRPIGATVARLCQDLGLDPDWSRWANEPWAVEEAAQQPPGWPYFPFSQREKEGPAPTAREDEGLRRGGLSQAP